MSNSPEISSWTFPPETPAKDVAATHFRRTDGWIAVGIENGRPNAGVWINPLTLSLATYDAGTVTGETCKDGAQFKERFDDCVVLAFNDTGKFPTPGTVLSQLPYRNRGKR